MPTHQPSDVQIHTSIRNASVLTARWSAIALGFSLPISAALDNILVLTFVLACLVNSLREIAYEIRTNPICMAAIGVASVMILGMAWSPLPVSALREATVDSLTFALLPLFMVVFKDPRTRTRATNAFLAATALILLISFSFWSGFVKQIPYTKGFPGYPLAFKLHITHSFLMTIGVLICLFRAHQSRGWMKLLYYAGASLATINVLFMVPGRTGQMALAAAGFFYAYSRYRWRGLTIIAAVSLVVAMITWLTPSSVMHQRAAVAWQEASEYRDEGVARADSSIGLRLEFYRNALTMFAHRPLLGTGTGGFEHEYAQQVAGTGMVLAHHPHNAFLLTAVELGVVGLATLLALIAIQWMNARRMPDVMLGTVARATLVVFVVGGLVSTTFTDHAEGLFFAWISGLLWTASPSRSAETSR